MPADHATDRDGESKAERTEAVNFRLTKEERDRLRSLRDRLQERAPKYSRITETMTFLQALDALERQLDKLDRDRGRER